MKYFYIEAAVAGDLGEGTLLDRQFHPPIITKLDYELISWPGDVLHETFPCWIITAAAMKTIKRSRLTGATFDDVDVTRSDVFIEFHPQLVVPPFAWMKVHGEQGKEDFGTGERFEIASHKGPFDPFDFKLVISQRALDVLEILGIPNATIVDFDGRRSALSKG